MNDLDISFEFDEEQNNIHQKENEKFDEENSYLEKYLKIQKDCSRYNNTTPEIYININQENKEELNEEFKKEEQASLVNQVKFVDHDKIQFSLCEKDTNNDSTSSNSIKNNNIINPGH